jgi:ATP-dependent Lon protease
MTSQRDQDESLGELGRALGDVPVFPLPNAVLFPGALLPLHIFEPRYRAMIAYCLASHRALVVARVAEELGRDDAGRPRFALVAGLGFIVEHKALPDGRSNILLQGRARVALEEIASADPFRRARATVLADVPSRVREGDRTSLLAAASAFAGELHKHADFAFELPAEADEGAIADLCAQHLLFDPAVRQAVLEERDVALRVRKVTAELAMQHRALAQQGKTGSALN